MFKSRVFLCILGLLLCLCTTSEARVCFLASATDESGNATNCIGGGVLEDFIELETEACPDKELCVIPRLNAASCRDGEKDYYDPADCCSNINVYEECSPELGLTCLDKSCEGKTADGEDYVACTIGNCVCDASFTETCDGVGQMGVGISCGGKYRECACDKSQFFKCGANSTPSGATCTDSTGTYRAVCECPQTDGGEWVDDPDECCSVSTTTCTAQPNGKTVYKCNPDPVFSCRCGFTYSKSGCQSGCTDSDYSYFGSSSNVICSGGYVPWLNDGGICGNTCQCAVGYWDFYDTCNKADDNKCEQLGYTETSCPGDYISCPFNSAAKKCLGEVETDDEDDGCEYATQMACEAKYTKSICAQGTDGCFAPVSCRGGYYKDVNEVNCPDGKFSTINGADAYGCGYCATEFASCVEAGYAAEPIANAKQVTVYLADGTVEKNCFAATSQDGCEEAFFNSVCEENEDGEWVHAGCETTDATTCPSSLAVSATLRVNTVTDNGTKITTDMAGCAKCESKCLYIDQADCVSQNANSVCEADDEGCFVPTVCQAGAYTEVNDTNCGTETYYDKLVNVDKNGCGRCGSKYTTCADLGYVNDTWSHVGGDKPSNVGDGHTFTFYNDKGIVFECWVLDNPCKYADQDACETGGAVCALKDGCYEIASCELGYKMTNGKCEKSTLYITQDECEADNPGYVCEKIWGETGYGEGYYYVPSAECQEHYTFVNGECVSNNTCESYGLVEECGAACGMCNPTSQSAVTLSGETVRCKACCQYAGARSCETANANSVCGLDENQCEVVQGCKEGYTLTNGKCISNGAKYNTLESCEAANQNSVCEEQAGGGYAATGCKTGYVTGWCLEGVKANADAYGCGECKALSSATCEEYGFYTSADSCSTGAEIVPDMTMTDGSVLQGCYACPANNIYQDVADCELKNQNSVCGELVTNGAAAATECKEGYAKKCSNGQMLKAADQFGCGTCCQYTTLYLCQTANPNGSCDTGADGCYYVDKCNSGYELVDNQCVVGDLQATYATLEECEIANLMRKCEPYGNGYEAGECYEGEYDDGTCKGVDSDYSDCEYDYASDPCQSDGHGLYLPTNCPRTKADCEKEYPYDICEKTTDANCWIPFGGLKYPNPADGDACKSKYWTGSYSYGALFCVSDTKELCQAAYPGFNCELSKEDWIDGYVPLGCASGYTFDSGYCIEDAANNCPEGEYTTLDVCEAHNTNTVCGPSSNAGCFTRDFCKTGYYHEGTCKNGQIAHADDLGCGYCVYKTKDQCLENSEGFDCTSIYMSDLGSYYKASTTTCQSGYTLTNGACVSNTPTCASGQVYADGACRKIETCEQYNLVSCDSGITSFAYGASCSSAKVVYNAAGEAIDCACNGVDNYVSSYTCQYNNKQATCGLADNGCYEVIMCNDGYELVNGQCVADGTTTNIITTCADVDTGSEWTLYTTPGQTPVYAPAKDGTDTFTTSSGGTITCQLSCKYDLSEQLYADYPDAILDTSGACPQAACSGTTFSTKTACEANWSWSGTDCCEQQTSGCWVNTECWDNPA